MQNTDLKEQRNISFYCYDCKTFTGIKEREEYSLVENQTDEIHCTICQSDFVEKVYNTSNFTPGNVEQYTNKQQNHRKEDLRKKMGKDDIRYLDEEKQEFRTIKKTIRLSYNNPFVRDVLIHAFPHVFRRANLERIQIIRNILNSLNFLNQEDENTTGPACKNYIASLKRYKYKYYEQIEKFTSCPICTDIFKNEDLVMSIDCGHTFHEECLTPWLDLNNTCPNCRHVLPRREL